MKTFNILYKTTNLITGKYYIGVHSTNKLEDGYLGSGKVLRLSINKYGKENHKREVLVFCNSSEAAYLLENKKVTKKLLKDPMCMNLKEGGIGGLTEHSEESKGKISKSTIGIKKSRKENYDRKFNWRIEAQ